MHVDEGGKCIGEEERLHDADGDHEHLLCCGRVARAPKGRMIHDERFHYEGREEKDVSPAHHAPCHAVAFQSLSSGNHNSQESQGEAENHPRQGVGGQYVVDDVCHTSVMRLSKCHDACINGRA